MWREPSARRETTGGGKCLTVKNGTCRLRPDVAIDHATDALS